ncbi:hypothetical protein AB0N07_46340 [Streptomyces sp. NPDC051172]|uniref:hypothetical protein n=1 Tax=Streptomyces sp. NPDC051172 TaxID=3155796 RepID=UPI003416CF18
MPPPTPSPRPGRTEAARARYIAGSRQQAVVERVDADQAQFLEDDSSRIIDSWATARGEGIDSKKVNAQQQKTANDADSSSVEAEKALRCTRLGVRVGGW